MKNKVFALALVVVGILATGSFAADRHIRLGGNLALGYNTVGGVDEISLISKRNRPELSSPFSRVEERINLTGANGFSGFGFELGGSVEFPINNSISLRGNILLAYRMHSSVMNRDSVIYDYPIDLMVDKEGSPKQTHYVTSLGEHSFDQFNIDIPILCRMILPTGDESGFYAEVGPVFNINLSTSTDDVVVKAENVNAFSMGISLGVGRPLPFEKVPVDIDVHLVFGILSMANDNNFTPTDITVRVGATYWFM